MSSIAMNNLGLIKHNVIHKKFIQKNMNNNKTEIDGEEAIEAINDDDIIREIIHRNEIEKEKQTREKESEFIQRKLNESGMSEKKYEEKDSSDRDSVIYTKNLKATPGYINQRLVTLESCTSSEFKDGLIAYNEGSGIISDARDLRNMNINIKASNV